MIFLRLKQERERLGLTQPALADLVGAAKRTVIDWEKGVSSPTAVQLAEFAKAGMDVGYVLTGKTVQARAAEAARGLPGRLRSLREQLGMDAVLNASGVTAKQWQSFEGAEGIPVLPQGMLQRRVEGLDIDASALLLGPTDPMTVTDTTEAVLLSNYRACTVADQDALRHQAAFLAARAFGAPSALMPDGRYPKAVDEPARTVHAPTKKKL